MADARPDRTDLAWAEWIRSVTGATDVTLERRSAGASRAGFAVDAHLPDGSTSRLWLRADTGHGPQSHTRYTVRREAAVYQALVGTPVRVPRVVAVHPTAEAFLAERLEGRNWFSEITDSERQRVVARDYVEQLAALHRLHPDPLGLATTLGAPTTVTEHVHDELAEWRAQYDAQREPEPLIELALRWLSANVPPDGDWPVVLVHGDAGPGNFLYGEDHVVAVMDWEMAHWGDLHDDLGWLYVRDVQERMSELPGRIADYERALGRPIDVTRLRYFRVLAQARCAIGTLNGLLARDSNGEIANHLIYSTLHLRLLLEALTDAMGTAPSTIVPESTENEPIGTDTEQTWMFDVALDDLRSVVVPALEEGFAERRAKGIARLLRYLREVDRLGAGTTPADRARTCDELASGALTPDAALAWCGRDVAHRTALARPAMGALADRHHAPLP